MPVCIECLLRGGDAQTEGTDDVGHMAQIVDQLRRHGSALLRGRGTLTTRRYLLDTNSQVALSGVTRGVAAVVSAVERTQRDGESALPGDADCHSKGDLEHSAY